MPVSNKQWNILEASYPYSRFVFEILDMIAFNIEKELNMFETYFKHVLKKSRFIKNGFAL